MGEWDSDPGDSCLYPCFHHHFHWLLRLQWREAPTLLYLPRSKHESQDPELRLLKYPDTEPGQYQDYTRERKKLTGIHPLLPRLSQRPQQIPPLTSSLEERVSVDSHPETRKDKAYLKRHNNRTSARSPLRHRRHGGSRSVPRWVMRLPRSTLAG